MKLIGVIGVGSPFGDDNIAQQVIALLKNELNQADYNDKIKIDYFDRPGLYLLEYMKAFKQVHLIDAMLSGKPVGTIHRYEDITILQKENQLLSSHGLGVAEVLSLGQILNCLPAKMFIHGIEIDKDKSINLSSEDSRLKHRCSTLARQIAKELINSESKKYID